MREIKFRGQCKASKEWVYGSYLHTKHAFRDEILHKIIPFEVDRVTEIIPEILGQFTGLYDKHGKEIYEGDIVKDNLGRIMKIGEWGYKPCFIAVSRIDFHHADFFGWLIGDTNVLECEIIGNIHDNPELLEQ